ncbi:hypothetical protein DDF62_08890 [Caulobacter radicis]|uniref:hypothetical protein n=1 Tax=Caulobacter radicis TaxID=2172650 RepID=UPI000D57E476|nr:hypothetical protein [Caulobacter radicis]PVM90365.1 hypothetical protein DDF62_08890 [Caulobacter radicis]
MSDTAQAKYTFLPYVRRGLAAVLAGDAEDGRLQMPVRLKLQGGGVEETVDLPLRLYGPGDVIGIDPAEVIRTEPRHQTPDFDPQYFPAVEFDTPGLPWMFSPEAASEGVLRPWLCLVVVRDRAPNLLSAGPDRPVASLECELRELPDLAETYAWAHAQVLREAPAGEDEDAARQAVHDVITGVPGRNLSRLLCPRRLVPNTAYIACVVPAFEAGRLAGLGLPVTPQCLADLTPAWPAPQAAERGTVTLPVYHHWRFSTGAGAESFETLVRRLERRNDLPGVGVLSLDVGAPGWGLPAAPGTRLALDGALVPPRTTAPTPWPSTHRDTFQAALRQLLNAPATSGEALVAPPIYGQQHAGRGVVPTPGQAPNWLGELNLDPRHRVAAGLGGLTVRARQDELMAAAWEQVEEIERDNQVRRQAQLAVEIGSNLHARLTALDPGALLQVTAPAHDRVGNSAAGGAKARSAQAENSVGDQVRRSALPSNALSAGFRRMTRGRGPIARRAAPGAEPQNPLDRLIAAPTAAAPERPERVALLSLDTLASSLRGGAAPPGDEASRPTIEMLILGAMADAPAAAKSARMDPSGGAALGQAAAIQQAKLAELSGAGETRTAAQLPLEHVAAELKARLDPAQRIPEAVGERVRNAPVAKSARAAATGAAAPLSPVMAAPNFPTPMYRALQEMHDMLLPGLENTPPNTLALLKTNPRFIEAFMVGLNHEFARELLWREYPTDQRGTYFRQFWDVRAAEFAGPDLSPIHDWSDGSALGGHLGVGDAEDDLVLLIRGDLLRRYPDALIYAVKALPDGAFPQDQPAQVKLPRFTGAREPEIAFVGFDLTETQARTDAGGWYFVLQEQPAAPRFGLDPAAGPQTASDLKAWRDVSWGHVVSTPEALAALTHAPVAGPLAGKSIGPERAPVTWGKNAGHMARITLQRTYRIAIHAEAMLALPKD